MTTGILHVLTPEEIEEAIQSTRSRGEYFEIAKTFFESGELYVDYSQKFPKVDPGSLRNSVDQNVKKLKQELDGSMPEWKIVKMKQEDETPDHVLLINMDVLALQQQLQNEA